MAFGRSHTQNQNLQKTEEKTSERLGEGARLRDVTRAIPVYQYQRTSSSIYWRVLSFAINIPYRALEFFSPLLVYCFGFGTKHIISTRLRGMGGGGGFGFYVSFNGLGFLATRWKPREGGEGF